MCTIVCTNIVPSNISWGYRSFEEAINHFLCHSWTPTRYYHPSSIHIITVMSIRIYLKNDWQRQHEAFVGLTLEEIRYRKIKSYVVFISLLHGRWGSLYERVQNVIHTQQWSAAQKIEIKMVDTMPFLPIVSRWLLQHLPLCFVSEKTLPKTIFFSKMQTVIIS